MTECSIVPLEYIDRFWPQAAPLLIPATEHSHGRYVIEDVYDYVSKGSMTLWVAHIDGKIIGAATTHKVDYPQKSVLNIGFWGGETPVEAWGVDLLRMLQRYAKEIDCECLEAHGRLGWFKKLNPYGYEKVFECFELPV